MELPPMRIAGKMLRAVAAMAETKVGARALRSQFEKQLGIGLLANLPESDRAGVPADSLPVGARPPRTAPDGERQLAAPVTGAGWPRTAASYRARYLAGELTPRAAIETALAEVRALERSPTGGPLMVVDESSARRDADAASARYERGGSRGPLDGVPIVVKEQTDVIGLPTRVGTTFLGGSVATSDATVVARLRAAGAIILGSTPMTEFGLSPIGVNPHRAMPRNPHAPGHVAGGSSTGSAVSVATGLCPIGVAADGGGSIRIPACLCGVFGIKPTFGRVSRGGDAYTGSMNHLGPIGASTADLALFLDVTAGADERDALTRHAPVHPAGAFTAALGRGVDGLRIGVLESQWADASSSVANAGRAALASLERAGARLIPVAIGLSRAAAPIGYLTIGLEDLADLRGARRDHRDQLSSDLSITLAVLSTFSPTDYLDAQRLRLRLRQQTAAAFAEVDLLALPSSTIAAPAVTDAEARSGFLDAVALDGLCRSMMLGNLTGLPAATAPVGKEGDLPVGLQLIGDAWDEFTVLAALAQLERDGAAVVDRPAHTTRSPWR